MIQSCRCTNSRGEEKISEILSKRGIKFEKQYRFKDLLGEKNRPYFFDFAIKNEQDELAYLIEFDGEQHFSYKGEKGWATEERLVNQQNKDHKKNLYCFEHNIPLIRIPYKRFNKLNLEDLKLDTTKFLLTKEGEQKYVFENTPKRLRKDLVDNN